MLTSLQNPLIKQIRKLHRSKERHKQNLFLLEGTNLLTIAGRIKYPLITVVATPKWQCQHLSLWQNLSQQVQRVETVSEEIMARVATTVNPDGVVATASRSNWQKSIPESIKLGLVLEKLQDPGNLGTIIRTAVATEVDGLWLSSDSVDLDHPKVMRASAGEWFRLPMALSDHLCALVQAYQNRGVQIIATLPAARKTYWELDFTRPSLILLGNESAGLSAELASLADEQVQIPLSGGVESLNVAIAAALLLYECQRQWKLKNQLKSG
jgi:TrmH family RNA methyltransferase